MMMNRPSFPSLSSMGGLIKSTNLTVCGLFYSSESLRKS
jgi:hypothetical protein